MVWKGVTPLREQCTQLISDKIWNFSNEHYLICEFCAFCQTEQCPIVRNSKDAFSQLPKIVVQSVYDVVYRDFRDLCRHKMKMEANLLYLLMSLVGLDLSQIKIKKVCLLKHDIPFILKFGKTINSLCFQDSFTDSDDLDWINISLWKVILQKTNNILFLKVYNVELTDQHFEIIGRECHQLKSLEGVSVDWTIADPMTKLFFQYGDAEIPVQNRCCETLETIHFYVGSNSDVYVKLVTLALKYVPNLKSVGDRFQFDEYLKSFPAWKIPQTNMEDINLLELTHDLFPRLCMFCPKMKKLEVRTKSDSGCIQQLATAFPHLEELHLLVMNMFYEIPTVHWESLRKLLMPKTFAVDIDIDLLIAQIPLLEELFIFSENITWNAETYFQCLKVVSLRLSYPDLSWFASFANTVTYHDLRAEFTHFTPDICEAFLNVPFPRLKYLNIEVFQYNFQFFKRVLKQLPKLEYCELGNADEEHAELCQFIKENNLKCHLGFHF